MKSFGETVTPGSFFDDIERNFGEGSYKHGGQPKEIDDYNIQSLKDLMEYSIKKYDSTYSTEKDTAELIIMYIAKLFARNRHEFSKDRFYTYIISTSFSSLIIKAINTPIVYDKLLNDVMYTLHREFYYLRLPYVFFNKIFSSEKQLFDYKDVVGNLRSGTKKINAKALISFIKFTRKKGISPAAYAGNLTELFSLSLFCRYDGDTEVRKHFYELIKTFYNLGTRSDSKLAKEIFYKVLLQLKVHRYENEYLPISEPISKMFFAMYIASAEVGIGREKISEIFNTCPTNLNLDLYNEIIKTLYEIGYLDFRTFHTHRRHNYKYGFNFVEDEGAKKIELRNLDTILMLISGLTEGERADVIKDFAEIVSSTSDIEFTAAKEQIEQMFEKGLESLKEPAARTSDSGSTVVALLEEMPEEGPATAAYHGAGASAVDPSYPSKGVETEASLEGPVPVPATAVAGAGASASHVVDSKEKTVCHVVDASPVYQPSASTAKQGGGLELSRKSKKLLGDLDACIEYLKGLSVAEECLGVYDAKREKMNRCAHEIFRIKRKNTEEYQEVVKTARSKLKNLLETLPSPLTLSSKARSSITSIKGYIDSIGFILQPKQLSSSPHAKK